MSMLWRLRRLFTYDEWANHEALAALEAGGPAPARPLALMAHIVAAEWLWLDRLERRPQRIAVWPELSAGECAEHLDRLAPAWQGYLTSMTEERLTEGVSYTNTKGERWTNAVEDILLHLVMHSAYHRGQIAKALREAGRMPPYTDYIHAVRTGELTIDD